jgi:Protein of unknown function (DUF1553)/Protein of unknown function (DUF1549)
MLLPRGLFRPLTMVAASVAACCILALAQKEPAASNPHAPDPHAATAAPNRLEEASRLTASVAGGPSLGDPSKVKRKNLIDEHLFGKLDRDKIPHAPLSSDEEFFRRVHLDLIGRIPNEELLEKFVASKDPGKRDKLIDSMIESVRATEESGTRNADPAYTGAAFGAKLTSFLCDLSRSVHQKIGLAAQVLYYQFLNDSIRSNRPFNDLVAELITAKGFSNFYNVPITYLARHHVQASNNFLIMHEDTADEMTVGLFRNFMGVDLNCISCHDGANHLEKVNVWLAAKKRQEFWQQAAFFGKSRLSRRLEIRNADEYSLLENADGYNLASGTIARIPRKGEGYVDPVFILTGEKPQPGRPLREELARMFTTHPQFARAIVNLFWTEMMGVGLVDPVYAFDLARLDPKNPAPGPLGIQPNQPELLEALAEDFRQNNHSLQHLYKTIAKSSAYQLSSKFPGEWKERYAPYYARKFVRRLTSEQIYDSIVSATGLYTNISIEGRRPVRYMTEISSSQDLAKPEFNDIRFFMDVFGQANRMSSDRSTAGSIVQTVLLLNGGFVRGQVEAKPESYLAKLLKDERIGNEQLIDNLFLRFLSRRPAADEKSAALSLFASETRQAAGENLQWALINKVDFIMNQ